MLCQQDVNQIINGILLFLGLDVEDELQQAEGDQQAHPAGSVVFGSAAPGPQPAGVHPSRLLSGPHLPEAPAAGGQPAAAAAPRHLHHLHPDGPFPRLHPAAPPPVGQRAAVAEPWSGGEHATAGELIPPREPVDL